MCNFFAQADALAYGKSREELRSQNVPDYLIPHRFFTGNRPSLSVLLPELNAYTVGQILALYEHQVAVQVGVEKCCLKHAVCLQNLASGTQVIGIHVLVCCRHASASYCK